MVEPPGEHEETQMPGPHIQEFLFNWDGARISSIFSKLLTTGPLGDLLPPSDSSMSPGQRTAAFLLMLFQHHGQQSQCVPSV